MTGSGRLNLKKGRGFYRLRPGRSSLAIYLLEDRVSDLDALIGRLGGPDRETVLAIQHPGVRRQAAVSRYFRDLVLSRWLGEQPRIVTTAKGKPVLESGELHFNLSHGGKRIALIVSRHGPVGIDVEAVDTVRDWNRLARRMLAPGEAAGSAAELTALWTLKEAWLKGLGIGIRGGLARTRITRCGRGFRGLRQDLPTGHQWRLAHRQPMAGLSLAWAARDFGGRWPAVEALVLHDE